ncbi:MraZ C-terminal domain-containing protein [Sphingomonas sp. LR55]|uniref:MraZ C-terminal domain-containing protein n=1 Tax=Sphingomonas sp. LR55 TaxID=3050231 RepID=UPI002FE06E7C
MIPVTSTFSPSASIAARSENTSENGEYDYNIKRAAASGEAVPFDGSGRFIMPAFPRFYAGIKGHAFFYGVLDYIEIWDPATLIATDGMPPVVKEMARFYMAEKGWSCEQPRRAAHPRPARRSPGRAFP